MTSKDSGSGGLTPRQQKWFATIKANLGTQTGKSMAEWVAIARTCPEAGPQARRQWLKDRHGVGSNHAAFILSEAFPKAGGWDDPDALRAALWKDPASAAILSAIETLASDLPDLVIGQRKSFTAFSRDVQFAAVRPSKDAGALLGLKLDPSASPRLSPSLRKESWSERLTAVIELGSPSQADDEVRRLIAAAHQNG